MEKSYIGRHSKSQNKMETKHFTENHGGERVMLWSRLSFNGARVNQVIEKSRNRAMYWSIREDRLYSSA